MLWNVSSFTDLPRFVVVVLFSVFVFAATCAAAAATVTVADVRIIDEAQCIMCVCYARICDDMYLVLGLSSIGYPCTIEHSF